MKKHCFLTKAPRIINFITCFLRVPSIMTAYLQQLMARGTDGSFRVPGKGPLPTPSEPLQINLFGELCSYVGSQTRAPVPQKGTWARPGSYYLDIDFTLSVIFIPQTTRLKGCSISFLKESCVHASFKFGVVELVDPREPRSWTGLCIASSKFGMVSSWQLVDW